MMIASCCITKYFRVPSDERRVRIAANTATPISGSPGADVVLTKYRLRNDNNNTTTNNNCSAENTPPIFPKSQCQVLWEKWHRQHRRDVSLDLDLLLAKMEDEPRRGTDQLHKDHADTAQDPVGSDEGIYKDHVEEVPDRTPVVKAELIKLRNEEKAAETTVKGNSNANQHLQGTDIIGNFYVANESLNLNNNSLDDHDICENCSGPDLGQESEVCKRKMKEVRQTRSVPLKIQVCPYPGQVRARSPRAAALYRRYIEAHCDPVHMKVAETTGMESHGGKRYSDTVRDNEAQTLPVNEKEFKLSKKFQSLELQRESSSKNEKKVYRGDLISYLNTSAIPDRDTSSFSTHLGRDDNQNQQACSTINSDNVCLVTSGSTLDSVGEPRFPSPRSLALLSAEAVLRPTIETRHTRNPTAAAMCMDKTQVTYM
ncbi:hypothetical protein MAR_015478 [Mya arenaria]|uniref:Uncharacterized protein n=1 Tax=Mya arenaria TaxID=6604 RepID=A0ABY7FK07_MYAAR|nr:hypothetical protein MAR_015478 [Mya arenaria]